MNIMNDVRCSFSIESMKPFLRIKRKFSKWSPSSQKENTTESTTTLRYYAGTKAKILGHFFNASINAFDIIKELCGRTSITSQETLRLSLCKKP